VSKAALFGSGLFFGGAIDHVILAAMGRGVTPYGLVAGVSGNWALGAMDLLVAGVLFWLSARGTR